MDLSLQALGFHPIPSHRTKLNLRPCNLKCKDFGLKPLNKRSASPCSHNNNARNDRTPSKCSPLQKYSTAHISSPSKILPNGHLRGWKEEQLGAILGPRGSGFSHTHPTYRTGAGAQTQQLRRRRSFDEAGIALQAKAAKGLRAFGLRALRGAGMVGVWYLSMSLGRQAENIGGWRSLP